MRDFCLNVQPYRRRQGFIYFTNEISCAYVIGCIQIAVVLLSIRKYTYRIVVHLLPVLDVLAALRLPGTVKRQPGRPPGVHMADPYSPKVSLGGYDILDRTGFPVVQFLPFRPALFPVKVKMLKYDCDEF